MVLDLENSVQAVTQQLIQNRKQEIDQKKLQISESEKMVLESLDFDTVEGISDKVALDHSAKIEDLTNRWTQRWREKGGVLSTQDKLDLVKDQRKVQKELDFAASDVAMIKEIQKELSKPNSIYDLEKTIPALHSYIKEGKVGSGGAINVPVLKQSPFGAKFMAQYDDFMKNRAQSIIDDVEITDRATGQVMIGSTNTEAINKGIEFLKTTPDYRELYNQNPEAAESMIEEMRLKYLKELRSPKWVSGVKPPSQTAAERNRFKNNYGWNVTQPQFDALMRFNETAEGMRKGALSSIQRMKGKPGEEGAVKGASYVTEGGETMLRLELNPTEHKVTKDGKVEVQNQPRSIDIPVPEDGDIEGAKAFYAEIWKYMPDELKQGIHTLPIESFIVPEEMQGKEFSTQMESKTVSPINLDPLNKAVETVQSTSANWFKQQPGNMDKVVKEISALVRQSGKDWIVVAKNDRSKISINDGKSSQVYDLKNADDLQAFRKKIRELTPKTESPAQPKEEVDPLGIL